MSEDTKCKVLIVDEHPDGRQILRFILRNANVNIIDAVSVEDALEVLETTSRISLVVTELPFGKNVWAGLNIIEAVRNRGITILVYTTHVAQNAEQRARKVGAAEFVQKPSPNLSHVRAAIMRLLENAATSPL